MRLCHFTCTVATCETRHPGKQGTARARAHERIRCTRVAMWANIAHDAVCCSKGHSSTLPTAAPPTPSSLSLIHQVSILHPPLILAGCLPISDLFLAHNYLTLHHTRAVSDQRGSNVRPPKPMLAFATCAALHPASYYISPCHSFWPIATIFQYLSWRYPPPPTTTATATKVLGATSKTKSGCVPNGVRLESTVLVQSAKLNQ